MRAALQQLVQDLSEFVADGERDDLVLVFDITDHEVPYVLTALESVDAEHPEHVFLHFVHPIRDVESYLAELMASVKLQIDAVNALRAQDALPPWPPLPTHCDNRRSRPSDRVKTLLGYVRAQLPKDGDHRIILGLLPASIENPIAYSQLIEGLLPTEDLDGWMPFTRVLLRDQRNARFLAPFVEHEKIDGIAFYDGLDFSPEAATASILATALDEQTPEHERMLALIQLAAIDFAHRRYAESFRKWGVCYDHYTRVGVDSMRALCVCGAADVLRESGKLAAAKEKYQQGLALPPSQDMLTPFLNLLLGISRTCILMKDWKDAEVYLDLADQVASKLCQVYPKCEIMERQGFVFGQQNKLVEARTRWRAAVDLSRELQVFDIAERALVQLIALFEQARMAREQREHERELAELRLAAKVAAHPHHHDHEGRV